MRIQFHSHFETSRFFTVCHIFLGLSKSGKHDMLIISGLWEWLIDFQVRQRPVRLHCGKECLAEKFLLRNHMQSLYLSNMRNWVLFSWDTEISEVWDVVNFTWFHTFCDALAFLARCILRSSRTNISQTEDSLCWQLDKYIKIQYCMQYTVDASAFWPGIQSGLRTAWHLTKFIYIHPIT